MYKKRLLAIILSASMVICTPIMAFATTEGDIKPSDDVTSQEAVQGQEDAQQGDNLDEQINDNVKDESAASKQEGLGGQSLTKDAPKAKNSAPKNIDYSTWTSEDFTYGPYEKLLYGCDYTRQFTVKGSAVTGFSEQGLAKLEKNKDLVIPAKDDEGMSIVGVANGAFKKKGLTSVKFPTGMMVDYDDTITHRVTKRGNFVIGDDAFASNNLTEVSFPEGVLAILPTSFQNNQITKVTLPKTIWWIENLAFAKNKITTVNFPTTCDFQLELHGMAFANNFIQSVRLPDFTEVVNKTVFAYNKGMEPLASDAPDKFKTYSNHGATYDAGVVYMYTDNAELEVKDRIHHTGKKTESQLSYVQSLVVNDGTPETQNPSLPWNVNDFIIEGTVVKGLSESGIAKRAKNKDLVIPDMTKDGQYITEIASANTDQPNGLFATKEEGFDTVALPNELVKIGDRAFQNSKLKDVVFPAKLKEIGIQAFVGNELTSIIMPDTVTKMGGGAFATNPKLERISLSKGLTEIPGGAFGCSDAKNYMPKLTEIVIPEGVTKIGNNAFAGNNFKEIVIPGSVKSIDRFAFSTKEYLQDPCKLVLNEGTESLGSDAFRNKNISSVDLPSTVTSLNKYTFRKEYSSGDEGSVTKVFVSTKAQYDKLYPSTSKGYHMLYLKDSNVWTAEDFTYGEQGFALYPAEEYSPVENFKVWTVTGLSDTGKEKLKENKNLVIPAKDPNGKKVQGVADKAFYSTSKNPLDFVSITLPKDVKTTHNSDQWEAGKDVKTRGDFFIGASAFAGNKFTNLEIPEGVIYIGGNAFKSNKLLTNVKLPKTLMLIGNSAFAQCAIETLNFPAETDFALNIDAMAFGMNVIKTVQLPLNIEKVTKNVFIRNTGMEPVQQGSLAEKKGGIVHMYIADTNKMGAFVSHIGDGTSNVQKLITGTMPEDLSPWNANDFTFDDAGTTITGLSDTGKEKIKNNANLILPENGPSGKAVTALGAGAGNGIFTYTEGDKNYTPKSVILPSKLKSIGDMAFALKANTTYEAEMTNIVFPEGLESIGTRAFLFNKLTSVVLPDSVTTLGDGAFSNHNSITEIKLSKGLTAIPNAAFLSNSYNAAFTKVKTLEIPEGVQTIGSKAFEALRIETLVLPSTLISIDKSAFQNHELTSLEIPSSVKTIGNFAFKSGKVKVTLNTVKFNEGLESIGSGAFSTNNIASADLPNSLKTLKYNAFENNENGVVKLYTSNEAHLAFNTDKALKNQIVIYDKLVGTGWNAADFTYDEATGTILGWSKEGNQKRLTNKNLVLPDKTPGGADIVAIGDNAFDIPLEEVVVTKFGYDSPNGMKSVDFPAKLAKIGDSAFKYNAFTEVNLEGIVSVGSEAFKGNDLLKASVPDTVTDLGAGAFAANDITEISLPNGMTKIPDGLFSMNIRLENINIPNTVTEIGNTAFAGARLVELTIPSSVKKIGEKAFHLHHLKSLNIPASVEVIGDSAFEGTYKATTLKNLTFEEGDKPLSIGKFAFKEGLLSKVVMPKRITNIGDQIFLNNSGFKDTKVVYVETYNDYLISLYNEKVAAGMKDEKITFKVIDLHEELTAKNVTLSKKSFVSNGKEQKPVITVKSGKKVLVEGTDYEVTYPDSDYTNVGTKRIIIKGINNYKGEFEVTYKITDKETGGGSTGGSTGGNQGSSQGGNTPAGSDSEDNFVATGDNALETLSLLGMVFAFASVAFVFAYRKRKNN